MRGGGAGGASQSQAPLVLQVATAVRVFVRMRSHERCASPASLATATGIGMEARLSQRLPTVPANEVHSVHEPERLAAFDGKVAPQALASRAMIQRSKFSAALMNSAMALERAVWCTVDSVSPLPVRAMVFTTDVAVVSRSRQG